MEEDFRLFVGVDWGETDNRVHLQHVDGRSESRSFAADGAGIEALVDWVCSRGVDPRATAVAIEIPRGALVDAFLGASLAVFTLNPKKVDRFRERYSMAGAKDDQRDAWTLTKALQTDREAFRRLSPDDPSIVKLREISRVLEEVKREYQRSSNHLRQLLLRYHYELLKLVPAADEPWLWDLVEAGPTPASAKRLRAVTVQRILRHHRIRRFTADEVKRTLQGVALPANDATVEACAEHALMLLPRLRLMHEQRRRCERRIEQLLAEMAAAPADDGERREHRDVEIFRSLPGAGNFVVATVLVESGTLLRERDYHSFRAAAGTAPVTKQSGKTRHVSMRHARNKRLQQAVHYWTATAVWIDPPSKAIYDRLKARGCSHARALRGVGDRLLRLLFVLLSKGVLYDLSRRQVVATAA